MVAERTANPASPDRMGSVAETSATTASTESPDAAKVLLIEDDEATRETMHLILTDEGYEILEATNAIDGHALLLAAQEPLVVVLDYRLPVMDGCDLLDVVAHDATLRGQHAFVMITASPQKPVDDCEETLEELDVSVLGKPFDIDDLVEAVQVAQQRVRASTEESA